VKRADGAETRRYAKPYDTDGTTPQKHVFLPNGTLIATIEDTGANAALSYVHTAHLARSGPCSPSRRAGTAHGWPSGQISGEFLVELIQISMDIDRYVTDTHQSKLGSVAGIWGIPA
jgi:hypothetical protein